MDLGHPEMLALLWLVPLAIGLVVLAARSRRRRLALVAGLAAGPGGRAMIRGGRSAFKAVLLLAALASAIFALARPRWGFEWTDVKHRGSDIVLAVDVSSSMLAQDVDPNRLERAKREISDLLGILQGDRVGLVAFAGQAFIECPLTEDYGAVKMFLSYLDTELIPVQGTDLGGAIDTSIKALFDGSPDGTEGRAVILITDGEDLQGHVDKAAEAANAKGVKIYTIGVGGKDGAPIPEPQGGFKKDARGNLVVTKPDEAALQKLALATGGMYARSVAGGDDVARLYREGIRKQVAQHDYKETREKLWYDRFQWFLGLALLCLFAEYFIKDLRVAALLAAFLLAPRAKATSEREAHNAYDKGDYETATGGFSEAEAADAASPEHPYNRAVSQYRQGKFAEAAAGFAKSAQAPDKTLAERSFFNLGNAQANLGKLEDAEKAYESALAIAPDDKDAQENLEYIKKLKQQQQQKDQQDKDKKDDKDNKDNKDKQQDSSNSQKQDDKKDDKSQQDKQQQQQQQQQKDQQDKQQGSGTDKQDDKPKDAPKPQNGDGSDQKDKQDKQQQQQQQAGQGQDQPKDQKEGQGADQQQQQAQQGQAPQLSPEDAERVLRAAEDNVKKYMAPPKTRTPPEGRPDKDW